MTPYYADDWLTVWQGDCREVMAQMAAESVHCVVTSPPYWGLRDYGTATWLGGDESCDHLGPPRNQSDKSTLGVYADGTSRYKDGWKPELQTKQVAMGTPYKDVCGKCAAVRQDSQLGLEATPEEYVENMVAVFREVRRVLRKDGTCWVNLGDSYISGQGGRQTAAGSCRGTIRSDRPAPKARPELENAPSGWAERAVAPRTYPGADNTYGWKPKDLAGIPWRVAFALQADGWYLRSDIIWSKPNPMPESVTDRPTKAHEYVFLLSKSPRYYYDADAVREEALHAGRIVKASDPETAKNGQKGQYGATAIGFTQHDTVVGSGRNLRSVWSIATQPYPGAHFATFPEKLVEPCVKAGTSERGVCPECGAPWRRLVERELEATRGNVGNHRGEGPRSDPTGMDAGVAWDHSGGVYGRYRVETTGWQPSCAHALTPVPSTVLDLFAGSGTTGRAAQRLGRRAVLIDLSGEYLVQAMHRNRDIPLGLESA